MDDLRAWEELVVVKLGGTTLADNEPVLAEVAEQVRRRRLVLVHGGGRRLTEWLERLGVESRFVDGLRVTDEATMEVAEMVLSGSINKEIVHYINRAGADADVRGVGLSGKDARLITVEKAQRTRVDPDSRIEEAVDMVLKGNATRSRAYARNQ